MPEDVEEAGQVGEAEVVEGEDGLVPDRDGWFIVNVADSDGLTTEKLGSGAMFEATIGDFPEFGINVRLLAPGQPASMYHRENSQEAFIVLSGEVTAIVEDEERLMRKGDFLHMPPGTAHVIVGAGDGPSSVLMVGARRADPELEFPVSEPAARFGASVEAQTSDAATANADVVPKRARLGRVPW